LCDNCGGTGKIVRHKELVRHFELSFQTKFVGNGPIPEERLTNSVGDLVYSSEINDMLYPEAPPEAVPIDVWRAAVQVVEQSSKPENTTNFRPVSVRSESRPSLQVLELVRVPYTHVEYRYNNQLYTFYIYDVDDHEKFYSERYPARWDRIERLVRSISADLMTPADQTVPDPAVPPPPSPSTVQARGYRIPIEPSTYTPSNYRLNDDENESEEE
jgi:hypothetical protein